MEAIVNKTKTSAFSIDSWNRVSKGCEIEFWARIPIFIFGYMFAKAICSSAIYIEIQGKQNTIRLSHDKENWGIIRGKQLDEFAVVHGYSSWKNLKKTMPNFKGKLIQWEDISWGKLRKDKPWYRSLT